MTLAPQATIETNTSLTVSNVSGVDISFDTTSLTLKIDDFAARYIEPACAVIAANIESRALAMFKDVYNQSVVTGAQTFKNVLQARKILLDNLAPQSKQWQLRINTQDNVDMVSELKGLFQQSTAIANQYTDGVMGVAGGFNWAENTHLSTFTRSAAVSYAVDVTSTTGDTTLAVKTGTGTALTGEVFTIAGVNRLHPETKVDTGVPHQFTLTADAGGAGTLTWSVSPAIIFTASTRGARDNVSKLPTSNDAITFSGTASSSSGISLAYHPDAFTFASADLVMPGGVDMASRAQKDGISIRLVRQYDINNDYLPCRLDVLWGCKTIRPQLACRLVAN
jgi:hypothetical protein